MNEDLADKPEVLNSDPYGEGWMVQIEGGKPVFYKFVVRELDGIGVPHEHIFVDLERRMKCGVGKCGHCQINDLYCCQDGPVFCYADVKGLEEAL